LNYSSFNDPNNNHPSLDSQELKSMQVGGRVSPQAVDGNFLE